MLELNSWHLCPSCCLDNVCSHVFSSGEGNVHNLTSDVMHSWIGICIRLTLWYSHSKHADFCELFHLFLNQFCIAAFHMKCFSNPLAAMESSSVYMCFPCYREFNTLEEVLEHQLTCTAEDEQPDTSGTTPLTVPVLETRVNTVLVPFLSCGYAWVLWVQDIELSWGI